MTKRSDHKVFCFIFGGVGGCGLGELAGSHCVLFLQEQVRYLGVQEFLRELVIGVAAPSDLAGSFLMEILHCAEGGSVEEVIQISKQISCICDCSSLSQLTCVFILLALIVYIIICLIFTCA